MKKNDTIELLKQCDAGCKMAVSAISEVQPKTKDKALKHLLDDVKDRHGSLGNEIHSLLQDFGEDEKQPNPIAVGMSWLKTNVMTSMDHSDQTVADLMTDGCNMGVKSLSKYANQYPAADHTAKQICNQLIAAEEKCVKDLRCYL